MVHPPDSVAETQAMALLPRLSQLLSSRGRRREANPDAQHDGKGGESGTGGQGGRSRHQNRKTPRMTK